MEMNGKSRIIELREDAVWPAIPENVVDLTKEAALPRHTAFQLAETQSSLL